LVIDASVWVGRYVPIDIHHVVSRRWLEEFVRSAAEVVIPATALAEVSGAVTRRLGSPTEGLEVIEDMLATPQLTVVAISIDLGQAAARLASSLALRGMDSIYVAVSQAIAAL
jgi:predicted nucleic acid-binding protein